MVVAKTEGKLLE